MTIHLRNNSRDQERSVIDKNSTSIDDETQSELPPYTINETDVELNDQELTDANDANIDLSSTDENSTDDEIEIKTHVKLISGALVEDEPVSTDKVLTRDIYDNILENKHEDYIPPIEEQREIIQKIINEEISKNTEGTIVNVVSESWFSKFLEGEHDLPPIDTSNIISPTSGVFNFNSMRLTTIPKLAFDKLVEWYGLNSRSSPVETHLIYIEQEVTETNENGELITSLKSDLYPEFSRPLFFLHHLTYTTNPPEFSRYNINSRYSSIPEFAVPRLFTLGVVVEEAIEILYRKESYNKTKDMHRDSKYRVWYVPSTDQQLNYNINPEDFHSLPGKKLIRKELHNLTLKEVNLSGGSLIIEEKSEADKGLTWPSFSYVQQLSAAFDGTIGLQNLGNTCFMNSALQCLVHIPELSEYFFLDCFQKELNVDNPLGMSGKIAESFANLIHNLFEKKSHAVKSYTPRDFKSTIGHFNSMFSGYQQQDSQEFLAFLLDGLHEDLNRILKKPITEKPELNDKDSITPENIKILAEKSWEQHKLRNDSIIIDLFTGLYKSTLICPDCKKISITFDPFSDLTLPLPSESTWEGKIILFLKTGILRSLDVELPKTSTYNTLKQYVASKLDLNTDDLFTAEIFNHQFYNNFDSVDSQASYLPLSDLIAANDTVVMYEIPHNKNDLIVPIFNTYLGSNSIPASFGIPFFITLNEDERKSFGQIRLKLEEKYEQLSTTTVFSDVRGGFANTKRYTKKDFLKKKNTTATKDVEVEDFKNKVLDPSEDEVDQKAEEYDSDVSLANPEVPVEYAFTIKLWDSTRHSVRQQRRSFRSSHNRIMIPSTLSSEPAEKIWMPKTHNNFGKLEALLDTIDKKKRYYYTFATSGADADMEEEEAEEKQDDTKSILKDDMEVEPTINLDQEKLDHDLDQALSEINNEKSDDVEGVTTPTDNIFGIEEVTNAITDDVFEPIEEDEVKIDKIDLVKPGFALVCEWEYEEFEDLFVGLGESGSTNTWTNPEPIANPEVEENRAKRTANKQKALTLDECLRLFSKTEVLGEQDFWYCSQCKEHRQASKQIQIWSTPDILSIHLKRFENQRSFSDKIDSVVDFPIEGLDMKPYLASYEGIDSIVDNENEEIYDLCAVDNHYGGLGGGHYTAYAKNFVDNKWYYYDDSRVSPTSPEKAITGAAYLLFYRKRSSTPLGGEKMSQMLQSARVQREELQRQRELQLRNFYEENKDSSDDELEVNADDEIIDDIDVGTLDDYDGLVEEDEAYSTAKKNNSSSLELTSNNLSETSTVTAGYDSDEVESIGVPIQGTGSSDENHRKLLKLVAAKSKTTDQFTVSDAETSAIASPISIVSDELA